MTLSVQQILAEKGVNPTPEHLQKIEAKWAEIVALKGTLDGIRLDDADIALRNIPGGDHLDA